MFLVTLKIAKDPAHNPHSKVTGKCPVTGFNCTDVTGEHHTTVSYLQTVSEVRQHFGSYHITRIEEWN